jgi:Zn-dependent protease
VSRNDIVFLLVLVPSVVLHEITHGWVAYAFGDDTAKRAGRLSLNPLRHVDPFGTVILPILLIFSGLNPFGWAKPVPVNPRRLRNPRQQSVLVSLAGPATNIVLALLAAGVLRWLVDLVVGSDGRLPLATEALFATGVVNVVLATFNLLPIPPLDGSAVVERVMPARWWPNWLKLRQYSMGLLLLLVVLVPGFLNRVFDPALDLWFDLL